MAFLPSRSRIIITCSNRLSAYLEQEVRELGYLPTKVFKTGVELMGTFSDSIRLNLNLRCASQVLYQLNSFKARNADALYEFLRTQRWEDLIAADGYFSITSNVSNPTITNNLFANVRVKDAIVDRFRLQKGSRPDSGSALDGIVIHLYWKDEQAEIFLDTSGETLSKHGYRKIPGKAPMLESLAAATILATKWNRNSPFVNPMCGSGTLAIEAALIATNRRPGLFRENYSFMHVNGFDRSNYKKAISDLERSIIPASAKFIATDISSDAVNISKVNASHAGVEELIRFEQCDFAETPVPSEPGIIYFNPEYGDRLGSEKDLEALYKRMGDFMKTNCQGYLGYIFTGNLELGKKIGLKPARRIEFYTSKIDCRLFEYELYKGSREKK